MPENFREGGINSEDWQFSDSDGTNSGQPVFSGSDLIKHLKDLADTPQARLTLERARSREATISELTDLGLSRSEIAQVIGTTQYEIRDDCKRLSIAAADRSVGAYYPLQFRYFAVLESMNLAQLDPKQQRLRSLLIEKLKVPLLLEHSLSLSNSLQTSNSLYQPYCRLLNAVFGLPSHHMVVDRLALDRHLRQLIEGVATGSMVPPASNVDLKQTLTASLYQEFVADKRRPPDVSLIPLTTQWLGYLTNRERKLMQLRCGFTEGGARLTLEQIGVQLGVVRERVRRIETVALRKLRHPTRKRPMEPYADFQSTDDGASGASIHDLQRYGLSPNDSYVLSWAGIRTTTELEHHLESSKDGWIPPKGVWIREERSVEIDKILEQVAQRALDRYRTDQASIVGPVDE